MMNVTLVLLKQKLLKIPLIMLVLVALGVALTSHGNVFTVLIWHMVLRDIAVRFSEEKLLFGLNKLVLLFLIVSSGLVLLLLLNFTGLVLMIIKGKDVLLITYLNVFMIGYTVCKVVVLVLHLFNPSGVISILMLVISMILLLKSLLKKVVDNQSCNNISCNNIFSPSPLSHLEQRIVIFFKHSFITL